MTDILSFLEITETTVKFIWASEECGHRHLYLITSSLAQTNNGIKDPVPVEQLNGITLIPRIVSKVIYT